MVAWDGLGGHLGTLWRLSSAESRSISAENPTGERGGGARAEPPPGHHSSALGRGWKARPCIEVQPEQRAVIADIEGPGAVQQMWMTLRGNPRLTLLEIHWDGAGAASVAAPLGDFFACGLGQYAQVSSLAVCVNPNHGFNCYWEMPFRSRCTITVQNLDVEPITLFYQINYALTPVPPDAAYFHAQFRRSNPLPRKQVHTLLDGVEGPGHYVGTYLVWGSNSTGWWGEGEVKFYLDGDDEFPTICGTGTEDYFGGAWNFDAGGYREFSGPYTGMPQVVRPDGLYASPIAAAKSAMCLKPKSRPSAARCSCMDSRDHRNPNDERVPPASAAELRAKSQWAPGFWEAPGCYQCSAPRRRPSRAALIAAPCLPKAAFSRNRSARWISASACRISRTPKTAFSRNRSARCRPRHRRCRSTNRRHHCRSVRRASGTAPA